MRASLLSPWLADAPCFDKVRRGRRWARLRRVESGSPHEAEALTIKGMAHAALEETGPARQALERAWRLGPSAMAAKVLAALYLGANETDRGHLMLQAAAKIDPADFRPWFAIGDMVYRRHGAMKKPPTLFARPSAGFPIISKPGSTWPMCCSSFTDRKRPGR